MLQPFNSIRMFSKPMHHFGISFRFCSQHLHANFHKRFENNIESDQTFAFEHHSTRIQTGFWLFINMTSSFNGEYFTLLIIQLLTFDFILYFFHICFSLEINSILLWIVYGFYFLQWSSIFGPIVHGNAGNSTATGNYHQQLFNGVIRHLIQESHQFFATNVFRT